MNEKTWSALLTPRAMFIRFLRMTMTSLFIALLEGVHRYIQTGTTGGTPEAWVTVVCVTLMVELVMLWRFFRR